MPRADWHRPGRQARVARSRIAARDLLNEALAGMFARPTRMALTVLGIVIGMGALVATVGLTRTAGNRIISQFDQLAATELFITARPGTTTGTSIRALFHGMRRRGCAVSTVSSPRAFSATSMSVTRWSAPPQCEIR